MERGQFTFYRSYYDAVKALKKSDREAVFMALCSYVFEEKGPTLSGVPLAIFTLIKPTLDASKRKAESGKKGGSSQKSEEANGKQNESKPEANAKQTAREKEKEKEIEIENEIEKERENDSSPPVPPSRGSTDPFSEFAQDEEFYSALRDFEAMRKKIKKPMTDRAKAQLLRELDKLADSSAGKIDLLNEAVLHCWQTVYAHDEGRGGLGKAENLPYIDPVFEKLFQSHKAEHANDSPGNSETGGESGT